VRLHIHRFADAKVDEWNWGGVICQRVIRACRCGERRVTVRGRR